jgi:integrase
VDGSGAALDNGPEPVAASARQSYGRRAVRQVQLAAIGEFDVRSYLEQWLGHMKGRVRPSTLRGYRGLLHLYAIPSIGSVQLSDLHPLQLQHMYDELLSLPDRGRSRAGLSTGTVLNLHRVLVQSLGWAVKWGLIVSNPASAAQPPRARRPEFIAMDQALAERILVLVSGTRLELPVAIAIATGLRRGELLGLRWGDVDEDYTVAHVRRSVEPVDGRSFQEPKTARSRRAVVLPGFLHPYLKRQRESQAQRRQQLGSVWHDGDLIVDAGDGAPVNPVNLSGAWGKFVRRHSLPPLRFHDLRHAHATLMLLQGVHPKIVSAPCRRHGRADALLSSR